MPTTTNTTNTTDSTDTNTSTTNSTTNNNTSNTTTQTTDPETVKKTVKELIKEYKTIKKKLIEDEVEARTEEALKGYERSLLGFITDIQFNDKGTELDLSGYGKLLEEEGQLTFSQMLRSQIIEEVIKTAGLIPIVDFTDLDDEVIDWTSQSSSSNSSDDKANGDGSMTYDEAWSIAQSFKYGGVGSGHDPAKAWQIIGTTKGHSADCYDATAWLYYVMNYKVGKQGRDVCNTGTGSSGSHHWLQLKENGQWTDPSEYSGMTRNLHIIHNRSSADHICRAPGGTSSSPPAYSCCPYCHNGSC